MKNTKSLTKVQIFLAYSHKDTDMLGAFVPHLSILERTNIVDEIWWDGKIDVGKEWDKEIIQNLFKSDIILLLISANFISSEYCYGNELKKAIRLHDNGKAHVIPIILKSCVWKDTPFSKIQALPKDGKPISSWSQPDDAFTEIIQQIKKVAVNIRNQKLKIEEEELIRKEKEYTSKLQKANSLFEKKDWKLALSEYESSKGIYLDSFEPSLDFLLEKINICNQELKYNESYLNAQKEYAKGNFSKALVLYETCLSLKKDKEVELIIGECKKFSSFEMIIQKQNVIIKNLETKLINLESEIRKIKETIVISDTKLDNLKVKITKENPFHSGDTGEGDDLSKIAGIGPKIREVLADHDIKTYAILAKHNYMSLIAILMNNSLASHNPSTWPRQAELASEGKWDELKAWQDELDDGKIV